MSKIIISGYFCTGKSSVISYLEKEFNLHRPKDYTTRPMRINEKDGNPYIFISKEKFDQLNKANKLFDPIKHAGNYYASDKEEIYKEGNWILDILPDSWKTYKKIPGVIGIYLISPNKEILKKRAMERKESEESIKLRLEAIKVQNPQDYHYAIEPQSSLEELCQVIGNIVKDILR